MDYKTIQTEVLEPGIMQLALNRPDNYNAVSYLMMEELEHFWRERLYDLGTVIVILKGNGEKGFCAGLDMKESMEKAPKMGTDEFYAFQARLARINMHMRRAPQPIIAEVHGAASGQGFSFVLSSDIRIISKDAKFNAAYINIGLGGADMACSYLLPRMIGAGRAYEFMYTGKFMTSEEAWNLGLVTRVVEKEKLHETAMEFAKIMMTKNHMALRLTKEAINMNIDAGGMEQALNIEDRNQTLLAMGAALKMNKTK